MDKSHLLKAAGLMLVLVIAGVICWEIYLRNKGYQISYDDGAALWSDQRDKVYRSNSTTFIGSSRIKYDLDLDTWKNITGDYPVMLAMEGTNPRPILDNLANDEKFKGRLVIDVTEGLFFSKSPGRQREVGKNLDFYKNHHTPAQRSSFGLNGFLESQFVFLDKDAFSLSALLDKVKLPPRQGAFSFPAFPINFNRVTPGRQSYMSPQFLADSNQQNAVKMIWAKMGSRREPPPKGDTLLQIFSTLKQSIDKIRSRGGEVIFVRTPSSGPFKIGEEKGFPRSEYWDKMLVYTNSRGIHYMDDPNTDHYICPEFSHLSKSDAVDYTRHLINSLKSMGWTFPKEKIRS